MAHDTVLSSSQSPNTKAELDKMKDVRQASAVGSIMYAMNCTRLDLAYVVSMTSKFQQNPGKIHWIVVKNILKYLHRTKEMFLVYGGIEESLIVKCYTNASFTIDRDDCKSHLGYALIIHYRVRLHCCLRSCTRSRLDEEIHWRSRCCSFHSGSLIILLL